MLPPFDHTCLLLLSLSRGRFCVQMLRIPHRAIDVMEGKHKMFPDANVRKHWSELESGQYMLQK